MNFHILVPLDGSSLAECSLPHGISVARALEARLTLLQVLQLPDATGWLQAVDPVSWQFVRAESGAYLEGVKSHLQEVGLPVEDVILEGQAADRIIEFAHDQAIDLIVLSSHGKSGLSGWNVSSVVQKILLRAFKSVLLTRAYQTCSSDLGSMRYARLLVPLDGSLRAECVLPLAAQLARFYEARLLLAHVVGKPEINSRVPLSQDDLQLIDQLVERNYQEAHKYLGQVKSQLSSQGIEIETRIETSDNIIASLHEMVEREQADLVLLAAHGRSGNAHWPYGSVTASLITYGTSSLLIVQDLAPEEVVLSQAEIVAREHKGH